MYRVLIVDDEVPFTQSLMMFDWQKYDCQCIGTASNGQEALEKCAQMMPHIVITDINMPIMNGLLLMQAIREQYPEIQTILLTVYKNFDYAQKAVNLGATDYLVKDMSFRSKLPEALEKAKAAFEQTSPLFNRRAKLLHRSGRLLLLGRLDDMQVYEEELAAFLKQFGGVLITVYLPDFLQDQHGLIAQLDSFLGRETGNVGLIVHKNNIFDLMTSRSLASAQGWLQTLLNFGNPPFDNKPLYMALSPKVLTVEQYQKAYQVNMATLEYNFYAEQPPIQAAEKHVYGLLKVKTMDNWLRKIELLGATVCDLEAYVRNEIRPDIVHEQYEPNQVRSAFERLLHQYEARFAKRFDDTAHAFLLSAVTLDQLIDSLLKAVGKLVSAQNGYSYPIGEAIAYISMHLHEPDLQLTDVAGQVYISPGYLSKKLKDETGQSFQELLIRIRMETAAKLLRDGSKKVYEIAETVGYGNYRSFTNAFMNYYGTNPKKYHK